MPLVKPKVDMSDHSKQTQQCVDSGAVLTLRDVNLQNANLLLYFFESEKYTHHLGQSFHLHLILLPFVGAYGEVLLTVQPQGKISDFSKWANIPTGHP